MTRRVRAAAFLACVLAPRVALGCPYCAQDRGPEIFLIGGISLLPLLLGIGIWTQVRRIERSEQGPG